MQKKDWVKDVQTKLHIHTHHNILGDPEKSDTSKTVIE